MRDLNTLERDLAEVNGEMDLKSASLPLPTVEAPGSSPADSVAPPLPPPC